MQIVISQIITPLLLWKPSEMMRPPVLPIQFNHFYVKPPPSKHIQDSLLLIVLWTVYICQIIWSHDMIVPMMIGFIVNTLLTITIQAERSLIPRCVGVDKTKDRCNMLTLSDVLAINQALPYKYREKWSLLFDSRCVYGDFKQSLFSSMRLVKKLITASLDYLEATLGSCLTQTTASKWEDNKCFF